ncbi:hypothetical protein KFZ70_11495 [Tamlana fucoidanivorans]|uniref:Membrane-associated sensor domain-containing protein n=1 Tax=Allotamlana fucoidanivorans TaxID=2583814 RepID=A0A5C4SJG5_9FLAO|nr:hypothetical protein [Tamlana fucoidanivorans]TNJ43106.1 hypothetical protein FGF67_12145 [Tamlana fucoidanivorans]
MQKSKIIGGIVFIVYLVFMILEFSEHYSFAFLLDSLMVPLIGVAYFYSKTPKNIFFLLFLLFYTLSDIIGVVTHVLTYYNLSEPESLVFYKYDYYIGNTLYIFSYVFLLIRVASKISFFHVLRHLKVHVIVLIGLSVYLVYVLQNIINKDLEYEYEYSVELVYNIIVLLLLSAALLNYFYRENKRSLFMFLGTLCIVFAEVLDVAYIYIDQKSILNVTAASLTLAAFYFYCKQTKFRDVIYRKEEEKYMMVE